MGEFANSRGIRMLAWSTAAVILALNLWAVAAWAAPWVTESPWHVWIVMPPFVAMLALLGWITFGKARQRLPVQAPAAAVASDLPAPVYRKILVPLDHTSRDRAAIAHAASLARPHRAVMHLLHVEEDATSRLFGPLASTAEVTAGQQYFQGIVESLARQGIEADLTVVPGDSPKDEIVRLARQLQPDLIVMGAHGHRGLKDLFFGNTINAVRHEVSVPVLVVGEEPAS
jgi:manganese transport protein